MAITKELAALLADSVYHFDRVNADNGLPTGWVQVANSDEVKILNADGSFTVQSFSQDGFQGAAYYNVTSGDLVVAFRGTEFTFNEEGYRDFIKGDCAYIGGDHTPAQFNWAYRFYEAIKSNIVRHSVKIADDTSVFVNPEATSFTGHSLGGGLAQLMGAQTANSDIQTYTFNPLGVEHLLNNNITVDGQSIKFSSVFNNIQNHIIAGDLVAALFDQVGTNYYYKCEKDTYNNMIIAKESQGGVQIGVQIDPVNIYEAHTITNFTGTKKFTPTLLNFSGKLQCLTSLLRTLGGNQATFATVNVINFAIYLIDHITPSGTPTGGASSLNGTIPGGIEYNYYPSMDDICEAFESIDIPLVIKAIQAEVNNIDNNAIFVGQTANAGSTFDDLINQGYEYLEANTDNDTYIYDKADSTTEVLVITDKTIYTSIENLINASNKIQTAVIEKETGNIIIGDNSSQFLTGTILNDTIYGNGGNDNIDGGKGNDSLIGGTGNDKYYFNTGYGNDTISDISESTAIPNSSGVLNKKVGSVYVNNSVITGGKWDETTGKYINTNSANTGITYSWDGINGSNLTINYGSDHTTIEKFNNGDLSILFDKSTTKDTDTIPEQLIRIKQAYAELVNAGLLGSSKTALPSLYYKDVTGQLYNVLTCEQTDKITSAYGDNILNAVVDTNKNYILSKVGSTLKLTQNPLEYSRTIDEIKAVYLREMFKKTA